MNATEKSKSGRPQGLCFRSRNSLDPQGPSSREQGWSVRTHRPEREVATRPHRSRSSPVPRLRLLTWPQRITTYTRAGNGKLERKNCKLKTTPPKPVTLPLVPRSQSRRKNRHRPLRYELKWLRPSRLRGCEALPYSLPGQWAGLRLNSRIIGGAQAQSDPRGRAQRVS